MNSERGRFHRLLPRANLVEQSQRCQRINAADQPAVCSQSSSATAITQSLGLGRPPLLLRRQELSFVSLLGPKLHLDMSSSLITSISKLLQTLLHCCWREQMRRAGPPQFSRCFASCVPAPTWRPLAFGSPGAPPERALQCSASSPLYFVMAWVFSSEVRTVRRVRGCRVEGANRGLRHGAATEELDLEDVRKAFYRGDGAGAWGFYWDGLAAASRLVHLAALHFPPVTIRALAVSQSSSDKVYLAKYHQTKYKVSVV